MKANVQIKIKVKKSNKLKLFRVTCEECEYTVPIFSSSLPLQHKTCKCGQETKMRYIPINPKPRLDWADNVKVYTGDKNG